MPDAPQSNLLRADPLYADGRVRVKGLKRLGASDGV
jgi:hypothetical protein